jgi:hypothetical protein
MQIKRTEVLQCRLLASVMMVGARERWERGDDAGKRHIPEARHTCREERKLVSVLWLFTSVEIVYRKKYKSQEWLEN